MKNLKRFIAKGAILFLLATLLMPGLNLGNFISNNLTSEVYAVGPICVDLGTQPDCEVGDDALSCYWDTATCVAAGTCPAVMPVSALACGNDADALTCAWTGAACVAGDVCGNGVLEVGNNEECDDGGTTPGDGCDASCQLEPVCGDSAVEGDEVCDDGDTDNTGTCNYNCSALTSCGDGTVQNPNGNSGAEQCDDGGTTPGDGCDASCDLEGPAVPMFVTSTSYNGALGGAAGGDAICQTRAGAAEFEGTWQAVLSEVPNGRDLSTFLPDVPYVRATDGAIISYNRAMFLSETNIDNTISKTELGGDSSASVWTGFDRIGSSVNTCADWTASGVEYGIYGHADETFSGTWLTSFDPPTTTCDAQFALYCIQTALPAECAAEENCEEICGGIGYSTNMGETCYSDDACEETLCEENTCVDLGTQPECEVADDVLSCFWDTDTCVATQGCDEIMPVNLTACENPEDEEICAWNGSACVDPDTCGNGIQEVGNNEACDDGNTNNGDGCSDVCAIEEAPAVCGNEIIEGGEDCDGSNLGGLTTCDELPPETGFIGGPLSCNQSCELDTTQCLAGGGEDCANGQDDDEDGDVDCADSDCSAVPICGGGGGEICDNITIDNGSTPIDDDEDGLANCDDPDCAFFPACGGGGFPAFIFLTSTSYDGDLGGVAGADAKCQAVAAAATPPLDGTWQALISDGTLDAADRLPDRQFMRVGDFQPIANGKADLLDGNIINPILTNEDGALVACSTQTPSPECIAWTGSLLNGTYAVPGVAGYADLSCNNWASNTGTDRAIGGWAAVTFSDWIDGMPENDGALVCDGLNPLYCFSGDSSGGDAPEAGFCGDGAINAPGEECDVDDLDELTCSIVGGSAESNPLCTPGCTFDFSPCGEFSCGDTVLDPGEECDDGNMTNGDGCNEFCEWEGDAGGDCWEISDPGVCENDHMCFWDFMAGPQGGMCVPEQMSPCNSLLTQSTCENDHMCFWDDIFFNEETQSFGMCIENFGVGYPDNVNDEIYVFPQPFNNPNLPLTSDGDPYSLENRPDMMMKGVPRVWDINMAPTVVGFTDYFDVDLELLSDYVKLYRYDDLSQQWTDVTSNITYTAVGSVPIFSYSPIGIFESLFAYLVPNALAQEVLHEIYLSTIEPLDANTIYRVAVTGVPNFLGQESACPDGSGNNCFTSTFKTGDSMTPGANFQGGHGDFEDNFSDFGCQSGDVLSARWPFEGATGVDPLLLADIETCDSTLVVDSSVATFAEYDTGNPTGFEIPGNIYAGSLQVEPVMPLSNNTDWRLTISNLTNEGGAVADFELNFTTGDFDEMSGDMHFGEGRLTINLVDGIGGDPVNAGEMGAFVIAACGDMTMPEIDPNNPDPQQSMGNVFYMDAWIPSGESSAIINGIPTPSQGDDFDSPCYVFLAPDTQDIGNGAQYAYTGGVDPVGATDYPLSGMTLPMPPNYKYAPVTLGDDPNHQATLEMEVVPLVEGTLSGTVCFNTDGDADGICDGPDIIVPNVGVSVFTMGPPVVGGETWISTATDGNGFYSIPNLIGATYAIEIFGENFNYFNTVPVSDNTTHNVIISLGNTLNLTVDNTAECWDTMQPIFYGFWPDTWSFNTQPVFGEFSVGDLERGTVAINGFGSSDYSGFIEAPGCKPTQDDDTSITFASSADLTVVLSGGLAISGTILDGEGDPVPDFFFGAQTVFVEGGDPMRGGFVETSTDESGDFVLRGLEDGNWQFLTFGTPFSFVGGEGDLPANGVFTVEGAATDLTFVVQGDKRVNILVTDGVNPLTDAVVDIMCDTGKFVHLGHSNNVWTYLPPGDSCNFSAFDKRGNFEFYDEVIAITSGTTPQDVTLVLSSYNTSHGVYEGALEANKITAFPGARINYFGHIQGGGSSDFTGNTVTFTYPASIADGNVIASSTQGDCNASSGTVTCDTTNIGTDSFFDIFVEVTISTDYTGNSLSTSLNIGSTNIDNVFTEIVSLSLNAPAVVDENELFTVYGQAYSGATVTLSRINPDETTTTMGTAVMPLESSWYSFADQAIDTNGTYTLKTTVTAEGVATSKTKEIVVDSTAATITGVTITGPNGAFPVNSSTGFPAGQIFETDPFIVSVVFSGHPLGGPGSVYGSFLGTNHTFTNPSGNNTWDASIPSGWTGFGNAQFDLYTHPDVDADPTDHGHIGEILVLIDPSGYVYDTVDSNRITGVTSTVFQLVAGASFGGPDPVGTTITEITGADDNPTDGTVSTAEEGANTGDAVGKIPNCGDGATLDTDKCYWSTWDATPSGQVNPQTTDAEGKYGWNVPQGWYRVSFQKAGQYSLSYSRDVYVPPAETTLNLNIGGYDIAAPTVTSVNPAAATGVARNATPVISFSEAMLSSTMNTSNIKLLTGGSPVTVVVAYDANNYTATITPSANLAASTAYTIRVTTDVKDDSSNAIAATYESTFTTSGVADSVDPTSTADVATGTYVVTQTVSLSATDDPGDGTPVACPSCTIYYTTNGNNPTTSSSVYSAPLTVSSTTTLKFCAKDAAGNLEGDAGDDGTCESPKSRTYTITAQIPGIPGGFSGGPLAAASSLNWADVTGATGYKVYRSTTSGSGFTVLASPATSLYSDYAVTAGTTYYYKVSATNGAGESGLSAEVSVTPSAAQQQVVTPGGGGGGGGTAAISVPSDSNTATSNLSTELTETVNKERTINRAIEIDQKLITESDGQKMATLTSDEGTITLKPNKDSTILAIIPANTEVTGTDEWDGKIDPPTLKEKVMISSNGETIEGSSSKLMRNQVQAIVKVGSKQSTLNFSQIIKLEVPVDLPNGTKLFVYTSEDGNNWSLFNEGVMYTVINGKVIIQTDHLTYFALVDSEAGVPEAVFTDIANHWAETYINQIASMGIVSGKSEGKYAPDDQITRAELTKVAVNAFGFTIPEVEEDPFLDVDKNAWYAKYIQVAKDNGIVEGWGDGNFAPNAPISRAATLKILIEAAGFEDVYENYQENYAGKAGFFHVFFPDVRVGEWYSKYVAYAKDFGIVSGYDDGKFRPGNNVTRAEVAKIVLNVLDL